MTTIDAALVTELRAQVRGTLLRPDEEGYDEARPRVGRHDQSLGDVIDAVHRLHARRAAAS